MCNHRLAVATYDASEVFCDKCPQRWKVEDILKIAELVINTTQSHIWKLVSEEAPPHGKDVLVSTPLHGYFVAWWAEDWQVWCKAGSRDVVELSCNPLDCYWQIITPCWEA